jgi:hypothetical protein
VSHCFEVPTDKKLTGEYQFLDAYKKASKNVVFAGPTIVSEIIEHLVHNAKESVDKKIYNVLVLMTDGVFNDLSDVRDLIVKHSDLPMSIIIIGIGKEDFSGMKLLDSDGTPLTDSNNFKAKRDIVQFVPFNEARKAGPFNLAKMTLAELPEQIETYYSSHRDFD